MTPRFASPVLALVLAACGSGGAGDPQPFVQGTIRGNGRTLEELNDRAKNQAPSATALQIITGVRVTAVDGYDETADGKGIGNIFLQDFNPTPGPNQGVLIFQPSFSPPSFRVTAGELSDLAGLYEEFQVPKLTFLDPSWLTPEMKGATLTLRLDAVGAPQVPMKIPLTDLYTFPTGRKWLSMLVTVENVMVVGALNKSKGRQTYNLRTPDNVGVVGDPTGMVRPLPLGGDPAISNELFDLGGTGPALADQQVLKRVTGLVTLFNSFHIAPRSAADIEP